MVGMRLSQKNKQSTRYDHSSIISAADQAALDHPIWAALTSGHKALAQGGGGLALRYPADIAPFAAISETTPMAFEALRSLIPVGGRIALFTLDRIVPPQDLEIQLATTGYQMIAENILTLDASNMEAVRLNAHDVPEMLHLVELTNPGPFSARTHELGDYLGIRVGGELVAMAGERMQFDGYIEISAVCVHPAHRGNGYAQILILELVHAIAKRGAVPMLHVFSDNAPAIALYKKLGFAIRQTLQVTVLQDSALRSV